METSRRLKTTLKRLAVMLVISCASAMAATLASVSLPVTETTLTFGYYRGAVEQDFSDYYELLVTGGTGTGFATLNATLNGDEGPCCFSEVLEGDARLSTGYGFIETLAGGYQTYCPGPTYASTSGGDGCLIPFTFGVPEILDFTGYAKATYYFPLGTNLTGLDITASVQLYGIDAVYRNLETDLIIAGAQVSFDPLTTPEPSQAAMIVLGLLAILVLRRIHPGKKGIVIERADF